MGYRVSYHTQANGLLCASALFYVRMPVTPKFTWQKTLKSVTVRVQVPGVTRCKPDVFATSALLKVYALPYLFHLHLMHDVRHAKMVAAVPDQGVTFTLIKCERFALLSPIVNLSSRGLFRSVADNFR